jgi:uncharacterized ubiquitin-like protein YukD
MEIYMKNIIVTVTNDQGNYYYDIEVPVDLTVDKLTDDMVQTLNGYNPSLYLKEHDMELICDRTGHKLEQDKTLEQLGVRNGDYIVMKRRKSEYAGIDI